MNLDMLLIMNFTLRLRLWAIPQVWPYSIGKPQLSLSAFGVAEYAKFAATHKESVNRCNGNGIYLDDQCHCFRNYSGPDCIDGMATSLLETRLLTM